MINGKKGQTWSTLVAAIIAVVVLLTVILYFTGAFKSATGPIDVTVKAIECKGYCSSKDKTSFDKNGCEEVLAKAGADKCTFA